MAVGGILERYASISCNTCRNCACRERLAAMRRVRMKSCEINGFLSLFTRCFYNLFVRVLNFHGPLNDVIISQPGLRRLWEYISMVIIFKLLFL